MNKIDRKQFRNTLVFQSDKKVWGRLIQGKSKVKREHIQALNEAIRELEFNLPLRQNCPDFLKAFQVCRSYLFSRAYLFKRVRMEATHLNEPDKDILMALLKTHFSSETISRMCFALLHNDQDYIIPPNSSPFMQALIDNKVKIGPVCQIYNRLSKHMPLTRSIAASLRPDSSQNLSQDGRRDLYLQMFNRTSVHLHNLAHGPNFTEELYQAILTIPILYCSMIEAEKNPVYAAAQERIREILKMNCVENEYGYLNPTQRGSELMLVEILKNPPIGLHRHLKDLSLSRFINFTKERKRDFYRRAHMVELPRAVERTPVSYLASVYSMSVGLGALKGWIFLESSKPESEVAVFENLREDRNFLAHGDLLRTLHNIQLDKVQINLLANHFDNCEKLGCA